MASIEIDDISEHIFKGHEFDIVITYKEQQKATTTTTTINCELIFKLIAVDSLNEEDKTSLLIIKGNKVLRRQGKITFHAIIQATSMEIGDKKFHIEVSSNNSQILPARTAPFAVISGYLTVGRIAEPRWYKDRGGKKNFIETVVSLRDHNGGLIRNRNVPLKFSLVYESNLNTPLSEELFKTASNGRYTIGTTGEVLISFRIEQVSRSHQHNKFILKIEPDISLTPRNNDISPTKTEPIEVLSKPKPEKKSRESKSRFKSVKDNYSPNKRSFTESEEDDDVSIAESDSPISKKSRDRSYQNKYSTVFPSILPTDMPSNNIAGNITQDLLEILNLTKHIEGLQHELYEKLNAYSKKIERCQTNTTTTNQNTTIHYSSDPTFDNYTNFHSHEPIEINSGNYGENCPSLYALNSLMIEVGPELRTYDTSVLQIPQERTYL